jgi:hypothetical protein
MLSGKLMLIKERKGLILEINGKGNYKVFRETRLVAKSEDEPIVLVVGFRLKLIGSNRVSHYLFQRICIITTPFWSGLPGFYVKLWMVDPQTKNYAGIYEWKGKDNAEEYVRLLLPVLRFFSVKGSVWSVLYANQQLDEYLKNRF